MKTFINVAQMKLATLQADQFVETGGYYTKGDAGAARYLIKAAQAFDGYGDHELANGNVAVLQVGNTINVQQFGTVGDGVTNDTLAMQAAIDYSKVGGTIVIGPPSVAYMVANVVISTQGLTITGSGKIKYHTSGSGKLFVITSGTHNITFDGVVLEGDVASFDAFGSGHIVTTGTNQTEGLTIINCNISLGSFFLFFLTNARIDSNLFYNSSPQLFDNIQYCSISNNIIGNSEDNTYSGGPQIHQRTVENNGSGSSMYNIVSSNQMTGAGVAIIGNIKTQVTHNTVKTVPNIWSIWFTFPRCTDIDCSHNTITSDVFTAGLAFEIAYGTSGVRLIGNSTKNIETAVMIDGDNGLVKDIAITGNKFEAANRGVFLFREVENINITGNTINLKDTGNACGAIPSDRKVVNGITYPNHIIFNNNIVELVSDNISTTYYNLIPIYNPFMTVSGNIISSNYESSFACLRLLFTNNTDISNNTFTSSVKGKGTLIHLDQSIGRNISIVGNKGFNCEKVLNRDSHPIYDLLFCNNTADNCPQTDIPTMNPAYSMLFYNKIKLSFGDTAPSGGTWTIRSIIHGQTSDLRCTSSGTNGTLTGVTGSISSGSSDITVNTTDGLEVGMRLVVVGVSGVGDVLYIDYVNLVVTLSLVSDATVVSAAISYNAAVFS